MKAKIRAVDAAGVAGGPCYPRGTSPAATSLEGLQPPELSQGLAVAPGSPCLMTATWAPLPSSEPEDLQQEASPGVCAGLTCRASWGLLSRDLQVPSPGRPPGPCGVLQSKGIRQAPSKPD